MARKYKTTPQHIKDLVVSMAKSKKTTDEIVHVTGLSINTVVSYIRKAKLTPIYVDKEISIAYNVDRKYFEKESSYAKVCKKNGWDVDHMKPPTFTAEERKRIHAEGNWLEQC